MANKKKFYGKRMVPEYLITKLETLEPGSDYVAGDGIDIEDGTISIDNTVALKSEIPTNADYVDLTTNQTIDGNKTFDDLVLSKTGFGIEVTGQGAIGVIEKDASNNLQIRGNTKLVYGGEIYGLPSKTDGTYTLATTIDIPNVTSSITQYSTDAITSGAVYDAIGDIETLLAAI